MRVRVFGYRGIGAPEESAYFVWRKVGYHLCTASKIDVDIFDSVGTHNALHHLSVGGQWHKDLRPFDNGRPMLVADSVAELEGCASDKFGSETHKAIEPNDHYLVHHHIDNHRPMSFVVIFENVAIGEPLSATERDSILCSSVAFGHKAALLRGPLIERNGLDLNRAQGLNPLVGVHISNNLRKDFHRLAEPIKLSESKSLGWFDVGVCPLDHHLECFGVDLDLWFRAIE